MVSRFLEKTSYDSNKPYFILLNSYAMEPKATGNLGLQNDNI